MTQWTPTNAPWWKGLPEAVILGSDDLPRGKLLARDLLGFPIDSMRGLLRQANVPADAIAVLGIIQPLGWFPEAVGEGIGIPPERVPCTHSTYAHIGGAAIAANLLQAREKGMLHDGSIVALYGHGAGFTRYGALLRWHA
jgi:3-oxoacyl-[acyl-carrier-protein] synthase III